MRRTLGICSVALLLAAVSGINTSVAAQAEPTITVEEISRQSPGTVTLDVVGTSFTSGISLFVLPCTAPNGEAAAINGADDCDISNLTPVTADENGSFSVTVTYLMTADLAVAAGDAAQTEAAAALVDLGPAVGAKIISVPTPGIVDLRITGSGFTPGNALFVLPCTAVGGDVGTVLGPDNCNISNLTPVTADERGAFSVVVTYTVFRDMAVAAGDVDRTESNAVLVPFAADACVGIEATIAVPDGGPIVGTAGDDVIAGTPGDDVIIGGGGNDVICGGDGNDDITAGAGDDWIDAGDGNDRVSGGDGKDIITAGYGDDRVFAGAGNDDVFGGLGIDKVRGGAGNDRLEGGEGRDFLKGGAGNDFLTGEAGNDRLRAGAGNDGVRGGTGQDVLWGGPGDDVLKGEQNRDIVKGGSGSDTCPERGPRDGDVILECEPT